MSRVKVRGELLKWARERARLTQADLLKKFPKLPEWEADTLSPTWKQLEAYAHATHAPFGYFFLPTPPVEPVPIPDFRTIGGDDVGPPSPNLLETIYICQRRQSWYRDFAIARREEPLPFVSSVNLQSGIVETAAAIRDCIGFTMPVRSATTSWTEALRLFISRAEDAGVLVMSSGVVGNNNTRKLDPREFRGFALADELAPVVFINGADTKAAQMFTLAHELAHIWLGASGLTDTTAVTAPVGDVERWCNNVAAELLVPMQLVRAELGGDANVDTLMRNLSRRFRVSTLVALRRLFDADRMTRQQFNTAYEEELARIMALPPRSGGGDFYLTTAARVSKRFARALVESTLEGQTLYGEAFQLLGISKTETFNELGRSLQFGV